MPSGYLEDCYRLSEHHEDQLCFSAANFTYLKRKYASGPGTELKAILRMLGVLPSQSCQCDARAAKMDEMGVAWCQGNIPIIIGWMRDEADHATFLYFPRAMRLLTRLPIFRPIAATVIQFAILKARFLTKCIN